MSEAFNEDEALAELTAEERAELKELTANIQVEAFEMPVEMPPWHKCAQGHRQRGPGSWTLTNFHDKTITHVAKCCHQCVANFIKASCPTKLMKKQPRDKAAQGE